MLGGAFALMLLALTFGGLMTGFLAGLLGIGGGGDDERVFAAGFRKQTHARFAAEKHARRPPAAC